MARHLQEAEDAEPKVSEAAAWVVRQTLPGNINRVLPELRRQALNVEEQLATPEGVATLLDIVERREASCRKRAGAGSVVLRLQKVRCVQGFKFNSTGVQAALRVKKSGKELGKELGLEKCKEVGKELSKELGLSVNKKVAPDWMKRKLALWALNP